jgi:hypothetical protein
MAGQNHPEPRWGECRMQNDECRMADGRGPARSKHGRFGETSLPHRVGIASLMQQCRCGGRNLAPPPERRINPAAPVPLARLPDESGVPVGVAAHLGGGAEMRPAVVLPGNSAFLLAFCAYS